jgi:LPXTG-motif cell wall-anchored protein
MAIIALALCLCLVWAPCAGAVSTADALAPISLDAECTLTLTYGCNGLVFPDIPAQLYRVAEVSAEAKYTLTPEFRASGLELNGIQTNSEWDVVRTSLETHILASSIGPDSTALTDSNGRAVFSGLEPGIYLIAAVYEEQEGWGYAFGSALVAVPGLDEAGFWQYDVAVTPKPDILPPSEPQELQFQVLKLWKDGGNAEKRPTSIEVEIFRNGESQQTVILSEENNWSYRWTVPADGAHWQVVERNIPQGYVLTVEERTTTIILTNSIPKDPPDTPQTGDSANLFLAAVLLNLSGAGLIALGLFRKRYTV